MDLEQQLRFALVRCEPESASEATLMTRVSAAEWRESHVGQRKASRRILFATLLVVAAAAAILAMRQMPTQAIAPMAAGPVAVSAPQPIATVDVPPPVLRVPEPSPAPPIPLPAVHQPAPPPQAPGSKPFSVSVQPLRNEAKDAASRAAVDLFFASVLDGLRAVPGLTLVETDAAGSARADYRLMITGGGPMPGNKFSVSVSESVMRTSSGALGAASVRSAAGNITACPDAIAQTEDQSFCMEPVALATSVVRQLRQTLFPPDPQLQHEVQAQLLDSMRDPRRRAAALKELGTLGQRSRATGKRMVDSGTLSAALGLAATATDPALRAGIWQALRGVGDMGLLQPLIASASSDQDGEVRLQAVTTLATDFAADARTRVAMQEAARTDGRPLVRAVAQRALTGDADWNKYIIATLKDRRRPDMERVEALLLQVCPPGSVPTSCAFRVSAGSSPPMVRDLLDDEAIEAVAQVLPRVGTRPPISGALPMLISNLGSIEHPAVTHMLLEMLGRNADATNHQVIVRLLTRRKGDPAVLAALEKISAGDPDAQLRELAAQALKPAAPAASPAP